MLFLQTPLVADAGISTIPCKDYTVGGVVYVPFVVTANGPDDSGDIAVIVDFPGQMNYTDSTITAVFANGTGVCACTQ